MYTCCIKTSFLYASSPCLELNRKFRRGFNTDRCPVYLNEACHPTKFIRGPLGQQRSRVCQGSSRGPPFPTISKAACTRRNFEFAGVLIPRLTDSAREPYGLVTSAFTTCKCAHSFTVHPACRGVRTSRKCWAQFQLVKERYLEATLLS